MVEIKQKGDPVLNTVAKHVPVEEITSPKIQQVIADMKTAMHSQDDAVAIAAPQIGVSLRIFVVSGRVLTPEGVRPVADDLVFINPKIIKLSRRKTAMEEGCLSVRWWYGEVRRAVNATVEAYNERGEVFTRGAGGLLAQIFQHETDHLEGVLFDSKAEDLRELERSDDK